MRIIGEASRSSIGALKHHDSKFDTLEFWTKMGYIPSCAGTIAFTIVKHLHMEKQVINQLSKLGAACRFRSKMSSRSEEVKSESQQNRSEASTLPRFGSSKSLSPPKSNHWHGALPKAGLVPQVGQKSSDRLHPASCLVQGKPQSAASEHAFRVGVL